MPVKNNITLLQLNNDTVENYELFQDVKFNNKTDKENIVKRKKKQEDIIAINSQILVPDNKIKLCLILPFFSTDQSFIYLQHIEEVTLMDLVQIQFGRQLINGICVKCVEFLHKSDNKKSPSENFEDSFGVAFEKVKPIKKILLKNVLNNYTWKFFQSFAEYNIITLGQAIEMFLPSALHTKTNLLRFAIFKNGLKSMTSNKIIASLDSKKKMNEYTDYLINSGLNKSDVNKAQFTKLLIACKEIDCKNEKVITGYDLIENKLTTPQLLEKALNLKILDKKNGLHFFYEKPGNNFNFYNRSKNNNVDFEYNIQSKLSKEQQECVQKICYELFIFKTFFLHGVTGSGKTEVYIEVIKQLIKADNNAQVLILLPEITIANSIFQRLKNRFQLELTIWHSSIPSKKKQDAIYNIVTGNAKIVIGVRSAILLPFYNLSLIIADEEHDSSFKQEESPTYNARDMCVMRGKIHNIPVILGSATPSVETYRNGITNKYETLKMTKRFSEVKMPEITIQNTRELKLSGKILTKESIKEISATILKGEQVMIFINRRGYARMIECKKCSKFYDCPDCDNNLVYHLSGNKLMCHYCGHTIKKPETCIYCKQELHAIFLGAIGIEKTEEELKELMPDAKIAIMSSDTMQNEELAGNLIDSIQSNNTNIILSTQIGAKGYNFKHLTLVIAVGVDIDHIEGDVKIFEKTYQLLTQVCGRAGRYEKQGKMIIQTKNPNNVVLKSMLSTNKNDFYEKEMIRRQSSFLPPFSRQICITIASEDRESSRDYALEIYKQISNSLIKEHHYKDIKIFGPIPNTIYRMKRHFRNTILLRHENGNLLRRLVYNNINSLRPKNQHIKVKIDVDPSTIS